VEKGIQKKTDFVKELDKVLKKLEKQEICFGVV